MKTMDSIQSTFINTVKRFSRKVAVTQKIDRQWMQITFGGLGEKVNALAGFLKGKGIEKGDRVGIVLDNGWQWVVIFFALMNRGAIAVPVSPEAGIEEINNIIADAALVLVFISGSLTGQPLKAAGVISVEDELFNQAVNTRINEQGVEESAEDDIACILYTSGTTAKPKGVMLSQKNLAANCNSIDKLNLAKSNDRIISILPLHHALALTVTLLFPVLYGLTIIYPRTLRAEELMEAMQEQNPAIFLAVPQIFYLFHQKIRERFSKTPWLLKMMLQGILQVNYGIRVMSGLNLSKALLFKLHRRFGRKMRLFLSGGARLDPKAASDLYRAGFTILEGYGLTETSPVLTLNPYARPKFGSVGRPLPDVKMRIENKNKQGVGEVAAKGPNIMKGYYKNAAETDDVLKDNWFYTGDLGYVDKQGYLFLTGRAKEVIVLSSGLNVLPEEIEALYSQQSSVKEMCVFEAPSRTKLKDASILWAMVVPDLDYFKNRGEVNLKIILKDKFDNVSRALPEHKRIRGFSVSLESLPRTLLGKIKRFEVKNSYLLKLKDAQGQSSGLKDAKLSEQQLQMLSSDTGKKIVAYLKRHTQTDARILPGDLLELDLGLDSLGRVELASGLEKAFNIKIEDEIIGNAFTVEDLIKGVDALLSKGADTLSDEERRARAKEHIWNKRLKQLPEKENLDKIDLRPGFGSWLLGTTFIEIVRAVLFVFYRLKISGRNNVPNKGPYIIFANHTSYLDGFIIGSGLPYYARMDIFFLGIRAYFNVPVIRNVIKIGRIIPLDFSTHLLESLRSSYYILSNNKNLCVFPEGERSVDGTVKPFKKGFGILAKETGAKLLPVCIKGAYEAWPRTAQWPKLHSLHVRFAPAMDVTQAEKQGFALGAKDSYEAVCLAARQALIALEKQ
ncbi:MAG: AMP-binding protein [Candidatus Omnitrophica bacterium]|nr:AMP-binding protein [Candidatus Omnitrophota bacterium]